MSPIRKLMLFGVPAIVGGTIGLYSLAAYARRQALARTGRSRIFYDRDGASDGRTYEAELFDDSTPGSERYCARFTYSAGWTASPTVFDQCAPTFEEAESLLRAQYECAGFPPPF